MLTGCREAWSATSYLSQEAMVLSWRHLEVVFVSPTTSLQYTSRGISDLFFLL